MNVIPLDRSGPPSARPAAAAARRPRRHPPPPPPLPPVTERLTHFFVCLFGGGGECELQTLFSHLVWAFSINLCDAGNRATLFFSFFPDLSSPLRSRFAQSVYHRSGPPPHPIAVVNRSIWDPRFDVNMGPPPQAWEDTGFFFIASIPFYAWILSHCWHDRFFGVTTAAVSYFVLKNKASRSFYCMNLSLHVGIYMMRSCLKKKPAFNEPRQECLPPLIFQQGLACSLSFPHKTWS